jgi:protein-tyrosine phosphatase
MPSEHGAYFNHDPQALRYDNNVRDEGNPIRDGYAATPCLDQRDGEGSARRPGRRSSRSRVMSQDKIRICFVCLGNICRSPTAEGVMRHLAAEADLADRLHIESAGTSGYHVGDPPDRRSAAAAARRGIRVDGAAQRFEVADFGRFDHVLAMDGANQRTLRRLAPGAESAARVRLLREHDPDAPPGAEVPDPYYGGPRGFEDVLDVVESACRGLLAELSAQHGW